MIHPSTLRRACLAILCAGALSACEKSQEESSPLGASSISQNGKDQDNTGRVFGPADFAGPTAGSQASGSEWRTVPLWGLGLSATTSNHTNYLHDGRARNVVEAIMWHGGEGEASRAYVERLSQTDRDALVAFGNSL